MEGIFYTGQDQRFVPKNVMKFYIIILAHAGSKGLPRKNIIVIILKEFIDFCPFECIGKVEIDMKGNVDSVETSSIFRI